MRAVFYHHYYLLLLCILPLIFLPGHDTVVVAAQAQGRGQGQGHFPRGAPGLTAPVPGLGPGGLPSATIAAPPSAPRAPGPGETGETGLGLDSTSREEEKEEGGAVPAGPAITAAPGTSDQSPGPEGIDVHYIQTTYYTCVTIGTYSHCGWHEPILDAGGRSDRRGLATVASWVAVAVCILLAFAVG